MNRRQAGAGPASAAPGGLAIAAQWGLWAAFAVALVLAYLLASGPSAPLPRPPGLDGALTALGLEPGGTLWGAAVALFVAVGIAAGALGSRAAARQSGLLARALAADRHGRALIAADGRITWCNAGFAEIMGDASGEVFRGLADRIADADGKGHLEGLHRAAVAGRADRAELQAKMGDGSTRLLAMEVRPIAGEHGPTLWCVEDITARRETELVIAQEHGKLFDFMDAPELGFYSVDGDGVFEYANRTFGEWVGMPVESLVHGYHRLAEVVGGEGVDAACPYTPFQGADGRAQGQVTFRRPDGEEFVAEVIQTVSGDGEDGSLKARAVVRNAAASGFEPLIAASVGRFRSLFDDAPVGIAFVGADGVLTECNSAFARIADADQDPAGRPVDELVVADDRAAVQRRLAQVLEGEATDDVLDVRLAASEDAAAALYMTPLVSAAGQPEGVILHLFDTTQHRRLEAQFAQSQKLQAVGQLAGGIAHDFNNLLTVMIGFCDLILQRHRPGEQTFADIMQIKQNANRAANLVRQLLAFSRQQTLQPKVINITDVLAELSNLLRRLIGVNITLDMIHGRDLGLVRVDQVQLEQVIINLAVNARDAMKDDGGTLTITTANAEVTKPVRRGADVMPPGHYVSIAVADTGTGIPKENLERIFEPFFSTKAVGSGTGLGLSTVYGIVTQTGGFVQVDSEQGKGTVFTIYLPVHQPTEEEREEEAVAAEPGAGAPVKDLSGVGTVLLVEDEDPVRMFGARALRNKGYNVLEAKNGDSALEVLDDAEDPIDLLISDVVMPELDGPGLVREVRSRFPDMKVIFISGYAEDDFREAIERESDIHFLPKPFSLEQLAGKVKDVLAG